MNRTEHEEIGRLLVELAENGGGDMQLQQIRPGSFRVVASSGVLPRKMFQEVDSHNDKSKGILAALRNSVASLKIANRKTVRAYADLNGLDVAAKGAKLGSVIMNMEESQAIQILRDHGFFTRVLPKNGTPSGEFRDDRMNVSVTGGRITDFFIG